MALDSESSLPPSTQASSTSTASPPSLPPMNSRKPRPQSHREEVRDHDENETEDPGTLSDDSHDHSSRSRTRLSPLDGPSGRRVRGHRRQASYNEQQWESILSSAGVEESKSGASSLSSPMSKSSESIDSRGSTEKKEEKSGFFKRWRFLPKIEHPDGRSSKEGSSEATLSPLTLIRKDLAEGGLGETGSPFDGHDIGKIWGD